ncbi:HotDog domain-containing protein [Triangularia verruculosa]|uniref:HotDog domain-containing protein n=1 Tax=Triangularia verruculosa TaxID=2587418 RepID=A0AAN7AUU3_9PEZI|nr:HotDog domain-containing protein [Triangularia verruculosa]
MSTFAHPSNPSILSHVQSTWDYIRPNSSIYNHLLSDIRLVAATKGRIIAHLDVTAIHTNSKNILHGAVSGTLCDWAGGMAIAAETGLQKTGVSTDMHVSYCSTAKVGDVLEIEAWVGRAGKNLGFTGFEIRRGVTTADGEKGPVVAMGSHTKFLLFGQTAKAGEKEEEMLIQRGNAAE